MKKFIYKSVMLVAVVLMAISCSTDDIDTFAEQENAIRFPGASGKDTYYSGYSTADGFFFATYSFIKTPMVESEVYQLPINIVGKVSDQDREVSVKVLEEGTTAPEGSYEILGNVIILRFDDGTGWELNYTYENGTLTLDDLAKE